MQNEWLVICQMQHGWNGLRCLKLQTIDQKTNELGAFWIISRLKFLLFIFSDASIVCDSFMLLSNIGQNIMRHITSFETSKKFY